MNALKTCSIKLFLFVFLPFVGIAQDHTSWSYNRSVYEVNVRQYTKEGTFTSFSKHLDRLNDLGVGIIWFMPIQPIGVKNKLGSLGSYYSVKDYYGVNPEFGTMQDFKAVVDSIHSKGMYVLIDWVANHTAWDNALTVSHPDWYVKNTAGNFTAPPGTNWSDVIQLDYKKQELRNYMIDVMKYWITETKIDGFRCDAASFIPIDFWTEAITELKKTKPGILMIAEDDGAKYYPAGFDVTYAWVFYGFGSGILPRIYNGSNNASNFNNYVVNENTLYPGNNNRLYFTSNHDENSWYGTDKELFGAAAETFIALSLVYRSIPLIYGGQEAGLNHRLKFFDKDEIVWQKDSLADKYKTLLHLKKTNTALWNGTLGGDPERVSTSNDASIFSFIRTGEKEKILAVFNLTNLEKTFSFTGTGYTGTYVNVMNNTSIAVTENYGMTLPAWGYKIFEKVSNSAVQQRDAPLPLVVRLDQNYPNPFNPSTQISFYIPHRSYATLTVYDLLGRQIAVLAEGNMEQGEHNAAFNGSEHAGGIYFYQLRTESSSQTKKLILIK